MTNAPSHASERANGLSIAALLDAVENELIPRLLVSHAEDLRTSASASNATDTPLDGPWAAHAEVARFAAWSANGEEGRLRAHVSGLLSRGIGLDAIYLHLFAPAARHLGEQWERDEISFVDVQLGLCRLHQMVCECDSVGFRHEPMDGPRSIMLGVAPGEQHTFGVTLAADFFRRHGWQVSNLSGLDQGFVLERIATTHYTAAGFSLHGEGRYDALVTIIKEVRECALNPDLLILVGGDFFARNPALVSTVGADLSAGDAHRAVLAAEHALDSTRSIPA